MRLNECCWGLLLNFGMHGSFLSGPNWCMTTYLETKLFFMTTTTLNVTPITENFQTCKPAMLDIPTTRNGTRVLVSYIHWLGDCGNMRSQQPLTIGKMLSFSILLIQIHTFSIKGFWKWTILLTPVMDIITTLA